MISTFNLAGCFDCSVFGLKILLVDMKSIESNHVGCEHDLMSLRRACILLKMVNSIVKNGESIIEDSCGDDGSILSLRITASLAFSVITVYSTNILHSISTSSQ